MLNAYPFIYGVSKSIDNIVSTESRFKKNIFQGVHFLLKQAKKNQIQIKKGLGN